MQAVLESAVQWRADIVALQEPPLGLLAHPAYTFLHDIDGRTALAVRSEWMASFEGTVSHRSDLAGAASRDLQVLDIQGSGSRLRVVNVYHESRRAEVDDLLRQADWPTILSADCVLLGDFNAHSPRWNPFCRTRLFCRWLEGLMDTFELTVYNDESATVTARH